MWTNTVKPDRPQMTIWRMRIARWTPNATNTHSQYVTLIAFLLQEWLHDFTLYLHYLSCSNRDLHVVREVRADAQKTAH
jgi:hypothetical protein